MHILGLGLHVIIAVIFAIHALRTGREMYWLFILFMFPLLGSIVYAAVVFIPEMRNNRGARRALRKVRQTLDPGRELREAREAFDLSPTVQNRLRLADALLADDKPADAAPLYAACLAGLYRDDADISIRHARALLESGQAEAAKAALEVLIAQQPELRSPEGHLLYARAVAACGERERARHEFDTLIGYSASLEARAHYANALAEWGDAAAAQRLARDALRHVDHLSRHAAELNAPWIKSLRRHVA